MQETQLLTQLNELLQKQPSGFALYHSNYLSPTNSGVNISPKYSNLCQNLNYWIIYSGAIDYMTYNLNIL
jgi:hypothetical protein